MSLVKCPDCGKKMSDKALVCPGCGCPNEGDFKKVEPVKYQKWIAPVLLCLAVIILFLCVYPLISQPSEEDSLFYELKRISHEEVIDRYGKPNDVFEMDTYFEYIYENVSFMNIKGELVFRFQDEGLSGDLIFARWTIDGAKYSEKELEKVCAFYDEIYDKRDVRDSGDYEWNNWIGDDRIWFHKPEYSGGYYDFEYRPW